MTSLNLFLAQTAASQVQKDIDAGATAAISVDLGKLAGYVDSVTDPTERSQASDLLTAAQAAAAALTPADQASNAEAFATTGAALKANALALDGDASYLAAATADSADTARALAAQKAGQDPSLAYLGIPDPGGIGTALNLSGQSPNPGLGGLTSGFWLGALGVGGATLLYVAGGFVLVWLASRYVK